MSKRLIETITIQDYHAKVYQSYEWDEIQVQFYRGTTKLPELSYHSGYHRYDKNSRDQAIQDAKNTARRELEILIKF